MWGALASVVVALLGGSLLLIRERRRKMDSEAQAQMATARQIDANTDLTLAGGWRELAERWEARFNELERKYDVAMNMVADLRLKLFQSSEDVRLAIREKHDCERQLDDMRERVEVLERNQRDRLRSRSGLKKE